MSKLNGIFIDGNKVEDIISSWRLEWDRLHPHTVTEYSHCVNCLHADCSHCGDLKYPTWEQFVGIGE